MPKSEVYSWRVDPEMLADLEREARRLGAPVASLLERLAREWLEAQRREHGDDEQEQASLRAAAATTFGRIAGGDAGRSGDVRTAVRARLARTRGR
jgi:hypothetical protein